MRHLIGGVRHAVQHESWYAALALVLVIPDACAAIEHPNERPTVRYIRWLRLYVAPVANTPDFIPEELYRFRCGFLHEGDFALDPPDPRHPDPVAPLYGVLNHVQPYLPDPGCDVAPGRRSVAIVGSTAPTTVDFDVGLPELCGWICRAAETWLQHAESDPVLAVRIAAMLRIRRLDGTNV